MARITEYSGAQQTIGGGAAQTLVFTSSNLESTGVVAYHVAFDNANNDLTAVDTIRVKSNGITIMDLTTAQLRGFYSRFASFDLATSRQSFTIPFYSLEAPNEALADVSQFPVGTEVTIEIELNSSCAAGQAIVGWTKTDVPARLYPSVVRTPMNIAASQNNARYPFSTTGIVQGFCIENPSAGIGRLRMQLSGVQVLSVAGIDYVAASAQGDMLAEIQAYRSREDVTDPLWFKLTNGLPAGHGTSFVELDTGAGWAGVSEELALYTLQPNGNEAA